jgi:hypothetical protein
MAVVRATNLGNSDYQKGVDAKMMALPVSQILMDWAKRLGKRVKGRPEGKRDQHSKMAGFHREGQPKPWAREV